MGALLLSNLLRILVIGLWLLILARVILSWIDPGGRGRFASLVISLTEPILGPIRRALPRTGMFDWSPMIVLVILSLLMRYVV
ncbi:MAG TPA: YggT family protein [Candidatus Limnocylindrales bacterium]|nr:YggT family protein [Candidatus Limnocylindrales bacterium]